MVLGADEFFQRLLRARVEKISGEPGGQASETKPARARNTTEGVAGHERMSSYDLLVCLDNALRSLGLGLASFAPKPTSEGVKAKGVSRTRRKQKGRRTVSAEEEAATPEAPQAALADLAEETDALVKAAAAPLAAEAAKPAKEEEEAAEPAVELVEASEPAAAEEVEAAEPAAEAAEPAAEPSLVLALDQVLTFFKVLFFYIKKTFTRDDTRIFRIRRFFSGT